MAVGGVHDIHIGLVRGHDFHVPRGHERVRHMEQSLLHAHRAAWLQPLWQRRGRGRDIELQVTALARPGEVHTLAVRGLAREVVERHRERALGRQLEFGRARARHELAAGDVAGHRDQVEVAVHQHLDLVAEHVEACHGLVERHDDAAAAGVVDVVERGVGDIGGLQPVEAGDLPKVLARRRFGGGLRRRKRRGRTPAGAGARRPHERRDVEAIVEARRRGQLQQRRAGAGAQRQRVRRGRRVQARRDVEFGTRSGPSQRGRGDHEQGTDCGAAQHATGIHRERPLEVRPVEPWPFRPDGVQGVVSEVRHEISCWLAARTTVKCTPGPSAGRTRAGMGTHPRSAWFSNEMLQSPTL